MAKSSMHGPFPLIHSEIDNAIDRTAPGTYVLGRTAGRKFRVGFVGRSDSDIKTNLHKHVGAYEQFVYGYHVSAKAAFDQECLFYHDFHPPGNKSHPSRSALMVWSCPRCYET